MSRNFLVVDPEEDFEVLRGLASTIRIRILKLLHVHGPMNGNDIAEKLELPQSTVSTNIQILEEAGLIRTETQKARKGNQKICHSTFDEVLDVQGGHPAPAVQFHRGGHAAGALYELRSVGAVRAVLDRGDYRAARRAGHVSRP
jgi:predicted transcriptional regulator